MDVTLKICVIMPRYAISGVPLAQMRLARALSAAGHQVELLIGRSDSHLERPAIPGIRVVEFDRKKVRDLLVPICRYLRTERPDAVFSAEDHLNTLVLVAAITTRSRAKISASSRVTPFDTYSSVPFSKRWMLKQLARLVNWRADALTCVSKDMVEQYRQVFRNPRHQHVYNIVVDRDSRTKMAEPIDEPWLNAKAYPVIVAAGNLQPWKGFDILLEAVAVLKQRGRDVRLIVLGEGPLHAELQSQAERLGIADRVRLPGFVYNPLKYVARADAFALSSRVEGMPNVLVEAMMCGCTPVATDCPTGPSELLADGRYGYLVAVDDPVAMADGIEQALDRPIPAERLAEAITPFEEGAVLQRHFELLGLTPEQRRPCE